MSAKKRWEQSVEGARYRDACFETLGGEPLEPLYGPAGGEEPPEKIGYPGQFPFTRGPYPTMYRGRLWTMRQFAGFGSPRDTNERYKFLLARGQNGLSVAFDMPTLMGKDADDPLCEGEVGRCGVAVSSLADMEVLFDGIPLGEVSTSMTINGPAAIILAYYIACAEKQGVAREALSGTLQNDILKEYIAQKEYLYPPEPSLGLVTDTIEFCTREMPRFHAVSISGYHIREAGSTAAQELAFTLADGFAYVEAAIARGLDVDAFAPRLSFFWDVHNDLFEEIAKMRAARRIYAKRMRDKYGAKRPESWRLRCHCQTAGVSLTAQQPENNIVRVALQALAGVLGGTQSLHTNSMDETFALPTEKAVRIALRTQQVIAEESGVTSVIDPLGGSWFVESLTDRMEELAEDYFQKIDDLGGVIAGIEAGFFQREIGDAAYRLQQEYERGQRHIVGITRYVEEEEEDPSILEIKHETELAQREAVARVRAERDGARASEALERVKASARSGHNVMPALIDAAKAYCTLGETVDALRAVHGSYAEPAVY
ncbi:MAG: acyl-CoA mutase large subunit family protein [Planctomycetota bacterium]|jgi:methylmalonyl-CoA mutase N-terminal domain/subunit